MSYLTLLVLLHVLSAIVGFGATFSFGVLGPLAAKTGGPQAVGMLKGIVAIEKKLVYPAIVIQPLTGVLLIFKEGWDNSFFDHYWLWIAIVLFATAVYIALAIQTPTIEKMIELGESGQGGTPEFEALGKKAGKFGPMLGVILLVVIYLMVVKPGG
ncbi:MAG: putative integral rane protein [Actinomycetota bacterium]|nr:putative integral rane protein [Actinomycetota bacterium]